MKKIHIVQLSNEEHARLEGLIKSGNARAREIRRAHILLFAAEGKQDLEIASLAKCCESTVSKVRKRFSHEGVEAVLKEKNRSGRPYKLEGKTKAHLIALATSEPPDGYSAWTMRLLADKMIALELVDFISDETVRLVLKKMNLNLGKSKVGVFQK